MTRMKNMTWNFVYLDIKNNMDLIVLYEMNQLEKAMKMCGFYIQT